MSQLDNFKRYTITSALPYANGPLHIGHLAGAYLPADIFVRYMRLKKKDVVYVCGSDEHGAAITINGCGGVCRTAPVTVPPASSNQAKISW